MCHKNENLTNTDESSSLAIHLQTATGVGPFDLPLHLTSKLTAPTEKQEQSTRGYLLVFYVASSGFFFPS